jgi:sulfur carrier protein
VRITLNGDPYDLEQPLSVQELLERLDIDPRRVAVEHNMVIVRRAMFAATLMGDGDRV